MNTRNRFLLRFAPMALVAGLMLATGIADAIAQDYGAGRQSMREKRDAARAAKAAKDDGQKLEQLYPKATREEPETRASRNGVKQLRKLQEAYEAEDYATAMTLAQQIAGDPESNAYEKAFAWLIAGNAASSNGDDAEAATYFQNALAANGLDNNNHYTVMFNLAAVQYGLDQYQPALDTIDRFIAETQTDKPEPRSLRGALLVGLERYDEAAKLYEEQLAAHPEDKSLMMNAASAYQQAGQDDKATALLARAQASGMFTTPNEYRALYVTYINADRDAEALKIIDDGLAKGIIEPGPTLAKDFMVLGQKAYYNDDVETAIAMYKRAAPIAADGEAALNLAKIYHEVGREAEAAAAARQALDKGVKDPADARKLLGGE
ncbi:MAG TPA: tetratricopeptide repeat protein [Lysobacter sp.]|nr:tetratricopeptide repeat protein [Lysobacter sp.]